MSPIQLLLAGVCFLGLSASTSMIAPTEPAATPIRDSGTSTVLPDTPQGRCAAAWIKLVQDGGPEEARSFEKNYRAAKRLAETPIEQRVARLPELRKEFGALTLTEVGLPTASSLPTKINSSIRGAIEVVFEFDVQGKLDAIQITSGGPMVSSQPLGAERRAKLVDAACAALRDEYVFPDKGAAMADAVAKAAAAGEYNSIADERALAERLTNDFRAVTNDKHLRVSIAPSSDEQQHPMALAPTDDEARRENWAFKSCEVAPGNIGVLRFDGFIPSDEAKKVVDASFAFLARCDAIVFDIRANGGGSPELLDYIAGYFFDKPTLLNTMMDRTGSVIGEGYSDEEIAGTRFAKDLPVFVVTSPRTFSCAEEFAYDLQSLKRATIVGQTTGGGAHPVKPVRLDDRMIIRMPHLRANNPVTHTNWEGTGVKPDVEAPANQAVDKALELARARVAAAKKPS